MKNKFSAAFLALMLMTVLSACAPDTTNNNSTPKTEQNNTTNYEQNIPKMDGDEVNTTPSTSTSQATTPNDTTPSTTKTPTTTTGSTTAKTIADGTYSKTGNYRSPAQSEDVTFAFTVKAGVVQGVELKNRSTNPTSQKFQGLFAEGIKELVIGKKVSELGTFDRVNGSSLTPKGFNQAVTELKAEA